MSNTKKICTVLLAADEPMTQTEIATKTGLQGQQVATALFLLANAGVLKKTGERGSFSYEVANVDEAKKRADGAMKAGRKPKEAAPAKPAKAKRRKPVKTKPTKRRATKRVAREKTAEEAFSHFTDQHGNVQLISQDDESRSLYFARSQARQLVRYLLATLHLIDPKLAKAVRGARR